jgi:hypothetical protein
MATRKKKAEVTEDVKVVKGSHLTVTTYPDGRTELEWDDEALMRDVQEALASVGTQEAAVEKPKRTRKKKNAEEA